MPRFFKSWRSARWMAFIIALAIDYYAFYLAKPFTPESFEASGIIALLLFIIFLEIALHMQGKRRIRDALNENQTIAYQVGRHVIDVLNKIGASPFAKRAIWIPVALALFTTAFLAGWALWQINDQGHPLWLVSVYTLLSDNRYLFVGYVPLLIAIPFVLEHVSEWRSHQYVLVVTKLREPQLHIFEGVLSVDHKIVLLESTVTIYLHQSLGERLVGVGTVELTEKAGGQGEKLECVWRPGRLQKHIASTR